LHDCANERSETLREEEGARCNVEVVRQFHVCDKSGIAFRDIRDT
jgi:hypothetical protein